MSACAVALCQICVYANDIALQPRACARSHVGRDIRLTRVAIGLGGVLGAGAVLGLILPRTSRDPPPWDVVSSMVGWSYFVAWSVSFYPQARQSALRGAVRVIAHEMTVAPPAARAGVAQLATRMRRGIIVRLHRVQFFGLCGILRVQRALLARGRHCRPAHALMRVVVFCTVRDALQRHGVIAIRWGARWVGERGAGQ